MYDTLFLKIFDVSQLIKMCHTSYLCLCVLSCTPSLRCGHHWECWDKKLTSFPASRKSPIMLVMDLTPDLLFRRPASGEQVNQVSWFLLSWHRITIADTLYMYYYHLCALLMMRTPSRWLQFHQGNLELPVAGHWHATNPWRKPIDGVVLLLCIKLWRGLSRLDTNHDERPFQVSATDFQKDHTRFPPFAQSS